MHSEAVQRSSQEYLQAALKYILLTAAASCDVVHCKTAENEVFYIKPKDLVNIIITWEKYYNLRMEKTMQWFPAILKQYPIVLYSV